MKKLLLALIAVLILAPAVLAAVVATFLSPMSAALRSAHFRVDPVLFVAFTLIAGWFGLATLVNLCSHFYKYDHRPAKMKKLVLGLFCGSASAVSLIAASNDAWHMPTVLALGPLFAAAVLGYLLWTSPPNAA